jgi:iron(III) transport system permease protein
VSPMSSIVVEARPLPAAEPAWLDERRLQALLLWIVCALLAVAVLLPVVTLLGRSVLDGEGRFIGLANFAAYFDTPSLRDSAWRSLRVAALSAAICVAIAYVYAYALTRSCMRFKGFFRAAALIPLLAPSLLMAISLIYLFGNQGLMKEWIGGSIYGERGIVVGSVLWTLPHALLILTTALATADARLHEAARTLGASAWREFVTVTLPGSRYGLLMAFVIVFVLVITDFGVPKVVGGQASVLATDIYKQVVGQQNFQMGAVVALMLLLPAVAAFVLEGRLRRRQAASMSVRAAPLTPQPHAMRDTALLLFCSGVAGVLLAVLAVAVFASLASYWPYDLTPSLKNYDFDNMDGGGWSTYGHSLTLAFFTAAIGAVASFVTAWLVDKPRRFAAARGVLAAIASLPLAIPGLALGLGYILFFNAPWNPLQGLYGTMAILVICTVAHFFSVAHLTQLTALRQLDREYEYVAESLGVPFWRTVFTVHLPVCLPALLEVGGYYFVNAMTTVSAVVFLYAPETTLASIAVLNMDDAGDIAPAAAMAVLIFLTAAAARAALALLQRSVLARTQAWRKR